jgi:hypothetical protein
LIDEAPNGSRTYLQRGLLKASHRAIDTSKSDFRNGVLYRPWRPHTNPTLITPGTVYPYVVEVFPVGHVLRTGHRFLGNEHQQPVPSQPPRAFEPKVERKVNNGKPERKRYGKAVFRMFEQRWPTNPS